MGSSLVVMKPGEVILKQEDSDYEIAANEIKVKTLYAGICGSDISVYKGRLAHANYPVIPGHEVVGEIVARGKNVKLECGTKIVIVPNSFCDKCMNCISGKRNICENKKSLGVNCNGIFKEEFIIEEKYALSIEDNFPLERAVLAEPLAVIVHAFQKIEKNPTKSLLIIGCGSEGMLAVSLASYYGLNVTVVDINKNKLNIVKEFLPNVSVFVPEEIEQDRFDYIIECAGVSASVEQSIRVVKPGGKVVLIGMPATANLPIVHIVRNEINIEGSIIYSFPHDFIESLRILADPKFIISHAVSRPRPISEFQSAYEDACSGNFGKILFDFSSNEENNGKIVK